MFFDTVFIYIIVTAECFLAVIYVCMYANTFELRVHCLDRISIVNSEPHLSVAKRKTIASIMPVSYRHTTQKTSHSYTHAFISCEIPRHDLTSKCCGPLGNTQCVSVCIRVHTVVRSCFKNPHICVYSINNTAHITRGTHHTQPDTHVPWNVMWTWRCGALFCSSQRRAQQSGT